ncbi:DEAD/DEAH box helicase family protein [Helicobacter pylori]|nr:DEAD/DEAH box helicase family protein [Helicobacter pylori]
MIFEKQDYQQECINNIITLLDGFDFKCHDALNLKDCFYLFHAACEIPVKNVSGKLNVDVLMETGTGKTFTYLNLIFALHKAYKQNKFIIFVPRKAILESVKQNIRLTKDYFYLEFKRHLKTYTYEGVKSPSNIINHYLKNQDELSVLLLTNSAIDKGEKNILNKNSENLFNTKSIFENIADLKPISIIDEPHLLKGEAFGKYFSKIGTLYFRFGATFAKEKEHALSNVAFCLDSISAFRNYLVKQIRVHSVMQDAQSPFLLNADSKSAKIAFYKAGILKQITLSKGEDLGKIGAQFNGVSLVKTTKDKVYLSDGATLEKASYKLTQDEISTLLEKAIDLHFEKEAFLFDQNIKALSLFFIPKIEDFRQIDNKGAPFIKTEFERLYKLKRASILTKENLSPSYREYLARDFDESGNLRVHQGYFSGDSIALNKGKKESKKENIEANDIKMILSEKEKLLSFQTPLRFIFSVWALQEGWDNPNIFTLIKLASSTSETSRHQQVGRGLRIALNQEGKRVTHGFLKANDDIFYKINHLDMLVSGEEVGFIEGLQKEIEASSFIGVASALDREKLANLGLNERKINKFCDALETLNAVEFDETNNAYKIIAPICETMQNNEERIKSFLSDEEYHAVLSAFKMAENPTNKRDQIINANQTQEKVKIRQNLAKEFKELWQTINAQSQLSYQNIQKTKLIESIAKAFNENHVSAEVIKFESKRYDPKTNKIITEESSSVLKAKNYANALQKEINALLLDFAKDESLPLKFTLELYNALNKEHFTNSPKKAFKLLKDIIKDELHANLLSCVSYGFCQNAFFNTAFDKTDPLYFEDGSPKTEIEKHKLGKYKSTQTPSQNYLYDTIIYDSKIEEEVSKESVQKVGDRSIEVFAKLPKFKIPTPYKNYEPDFAYLLKDNKGAKIFFVCETKGYEKESDIPQNEQRKIEYAKIFFETLSQNLKNAKKEIRVVFATRINKQDLLSALKSALKETP